MPYDISHYSGWIAAAFLLGAVVGWLTFSGPHRQWLAGWFTWGAGLFVLGLIAAIFHLLPGSFGLYLETALLLFGGYILGGHVGAWLKSLTTDQSASTASTQAAATTNSAATSDSLTGKVAAAGATSATPTAASAIGTVANAAADHAAGVSAKASDVASPAASTAVGVAASQTSATAGAASVMSVKAADTATAYATAAASTANSTTSTAAANATKTGEIAAAATGGAAVAAKAAHAPATVTFRHEKTASSAKPTLHYGPYHALVTPSDSHLPGTAPTLLVRAEDGRGDDLTQIKGIGPVNQSVLNGLGVHHFHQIAGWTPDNATWMGHKMAFPGRVEREEWVPQAQQLALERPVPAPKAADPAPSPALPDEGAHEGKRPPGLVEARGASADDLKRIRGIGPQNEERLHGLGIWHFDQIASWNHDEVRWVGSYLAFPGRIDREEWVSQSKVLAAEAFNPAKRT